MSDNEIDLYIHYRARHDESIEQRHAEIAGKMASIGSPLGWKGLTIPPAPDCGADLGASYSIKYPVHGLEFEGDYIYRGQTYHYRDESFYDDKVSITFKASNKSLIYGSVLRNQFLEVIIAMRGYLAIAYYGSHFVHFRKREQQVYDELKTKGTLNIDGRNNIFTLNPAHYWDAQLCQRALGYDRDEVIRRLSGKVPLVKPLMDGVYVVFNDNPDLTFEEFCAVNDRFKPILGLA